MQQSCSFIHVYNTQSYISMYMCDFWNLVHHILKLVHQELLWSRVLWLNKPCTVRASCGLCACPSCRSSWPSSFRATLIQRILIGYLEDLGPSEFFPSWFDQFTLFECLEFLLYNNLQSIYTIKAKNGVQCHTFSSNFTLRQDTKLSTTATNKSKKKSIHFISQHIHRTPLTAHARKVNNPYPLLFS
jgi:hypothetical protein